MEAKRCPAAKVSNQLYGDVPGANQKWSLKYFSPKLEWKKSERLDKYQRAQDGPKTPWSMMDWKTWWKKRYNYHWAITNSGKDGMRTTWIPKREYQWWKGAAECFNEAARPISKAFYALANYCDLCQQASSVVHWFLLFKSLPGREIMLALASDVKNRWLKPDIQPQFGAPLAFLNLLMKCCPSWNLLGSQKDRDCKILEIKYIYSLYPVV